MSERIPKPDDVMDWNQYFHGDIYGLHRTEVTKFRNGKVIYVQDETIHNFDTTEEYETWLEERYQRFLLNNFT